MAKSSTLPTQVEPAFYDAQIPILYPGTMQEVIDLGLHGIALSRYSGLWVAFKVVTTVGRRVRRRRGGGRTGSSLSTPDWRSTASRGATSSGPAWSRRSASSRRRTIAYGRLEARGGLRGGQRPQRDHRRHRSGPAGDRGRGPHLPGAAPGPLRPGPSTTTPLRRLGIRLLRLGMVWPLEPEIVGRFAAGLDEILVLDEKRGGAFIELFVRDILYRRAGAPRVVGKTDERGRRAGARRRRTRRRPDRGRSWRTGCAPGC